MLKRNLIVCNLLLAATIITGCAKYKPHPFAPSFGPKQVEAGVESAAHTLSVSDCKHTFSRNVEKKGYKTIQLTITNNTEKAYVLNARSINLPLESISFITKKAQIKALNRGLLWVIPSLFIFGIPFLIVAACDGGMSSSANSKLAHDFKERCIDFSSQVEIPPHSTTNRMMFVAQENYGRILSFNLKSQSETENNLKFRLSI